MSCTWTLSSLSVRLFLRLADEAPIATVPAAETTLRAALQDEILQRHGVLRVLRDGFLSLRQRPLRLAHSEVERPQMQLVVVGMKQHPTTQPQRPSLFLNRGVELQLVLFVVRLRGQPRKTLAGECDERRGRLGLNLRMLDIELRELYRVCAVRRERIDIRAVPQPVRSELACKRQVCGRPRRLADDMRRTRERLVETLCESGSRFVTATS